MPLPQLRERAGQYELLGEIGAGGMATVHLGRLLGAAGFSRTVAVKRPLRPLARDASFRHLASREARLAARVRHPNVVPTIDVVEHGVELLIVMEYVHGESLATLTSLARAQGERIPLSIALAIVSGALTGLEAVHRARDEAGAPLGLIHRDVSPQNILCCVNGLAHLGDFGLAKAAGESNLSAQGEFKGKLAYASPEQLELGILTKATDIYSLGIVLWELLSGKRLYAGLSPAEIVVRGLGATVPLPSCGRADPSPELARILARALAREPIKRFESAIAMAEAIHACCRVATPAEVASWVRRIAADTIAERERLLIAAECEPPPDENSALRASAPSAKTRLEGSQRRPVRQSPKRAIHTLYAAVGATVAFLSVELATRPAAPPAGSASQGSSGPTPPAVSSRSRPLPQRTSPPLGSVSAGEAAAPRTPPIPSARSEALAASRRSARVGPNPARPSAIGASKGVREGEAESEKEVLSVLECSPPFSVDADGIRHMKPGCR